MYWFWNTNVIDSCKITRSVTTSGYDNKVLKRFSLEQNYPNPFNPSTTIIYTISENSEVSLKIFNPMGEVIETLIDEEMADGKYSVKFNASNHPSGIYFYQLQAGNFIERKKMVLIK